MAEHEVPSLLEVGRITKPHGLAGDLLVVLMSTRAERLDKGSVLSTEDGRTLTIKSSRPHQDRYIVRFDGVEGRNDADELRGTLLLAAPVEVADDSDEIYVHELIGCEMVEVDGTSHGAIESIEENPASDLLVTADGALVPARFIVEFTPGGPVVVDVPEGLFSIDD